jgi:hypothetical protein
MEVSMDGLRKRLIADFNSLTKKMNESIVDKSWNPEIIIYPEDIRKEMESIRGLIATLAFCYIDGEFEALDENTHFEDFFENENL